MENIDNELLTVKAETMAMTAEMQDDKQQELTSVGEKYGLSKVEFMKLLIEITNIVEDIEEEE
ncbi:hypothetical protein [Staphylococcus nepalensis]|uniref:hypothetical protein n=1 Tax=Staphylococcus nepalensis TaxID=214473 RepID=UPI003CE67A11